jgi:transcription elongation factor
VESEKVARVRALFPQSHDIFCLPPEEHDAFFSFLHKDGRAPSAGNWIRFRRGQHKGDLAIVIDSSEAHDLVHVAMVPRISLVPGTAGKRRRTAKVQPALFDPKVIRTAYGQRSVSQDQEGFRFQGRTYANGLCLVNVQAAHAIVREPHPSLEELLLFREAGLETIQSAVADALCQESIRTLWQRGDRMEVISGAFVGSLGCLESLNFDLRSAEIVLSAYDAVDPNMLSQHIALDCLQRYILKGDSVLVMAGRSNGRRGLVVSVDDENVTFVEDKARVEVSCPPFNAP